jgi:MSHA pilin protein MshA
MTDYIFHNLSISIRESIMNNKGFTLIELVVVIVILGILAVTAVPKYINLQADAKTATLQAIKSSLQGAAALVHVKSIVKGNQNEPFTQVITETVNIGDSIDNGELIITYGYPIGYAEGQFDRLVNIDSQYEYTQLGGNLSRFAIYFKADGEPATINQDCIVSYIQSSGVNQKPTFQVNDCI